MKIKMKFEQINIVRKNKKMLKGLPVAPGEHLVINGEVLHSNPVNLVIGNHVKINSGFINPVGNEVPCSFSTVGDAQIIIKDGAGISNTTFFARAGITVGENTYIGGGCRIYDTDFHPLDPEKRKLNHPEDISSKPIVIGDNVFIGAHSILLKGVTIGDGSVIGAGSVVRKSIPAGEIWAGNPAQFIRKVSK